MEIQLIDDNSPKWGNLRSNQRSGAVYGVVGPAQSASLPAGSWNTLRITCRGEFVNVSINGKPVTDLIMSEYFGKGFFPRKGFIGLYNWNGEALEAAFRKIRLRDLESPSQNYDEEEELDRWFAPLPHGRFSGTNQSLQDWHRTRANQLRAQQSQLQEAANRQAEEEAARAMRNFRSRHSP